MNTLLKLTIILATIGAINWGLVAMFDYNLVETFFGAGTLLTRIIYIVVMASGVMNLALLFKDLDHDRK